MKMRTTPLGTIAAFGVAMCSGLPAGWAVPSAELTKSANTVIALEEAQDYTLAARAVAVSKDVALLGTDRETAWVFRRDGDAWVPMQELRTRDPGARRFGTALALAGDTLVVGAMDDDTMGVDAGAAYVFERSGDAWTLKQKLLAADGAGADRFGASVASDGSRIVVGAAGGDGPTANGGSVYVYDKSGEQWVEEFHFTPADAGIHFFSGSAVDLDGSRIGLGTVAVLDGGHVSGRVHVLELEGQTWVEKAAFTTMTGGLSFMATPTMSVSDTRIALSQITRVERAGIQENAVYVWALQGDSWVLEAELDASAVCGSDGFAHSVAIENDTILVGDIGSSTAAEPGCGFLYRYEEGAWHCVNVILPENLDPSAAFGFAVDMNEGQFIIGAPFADLSGVDTGCAYVERVAALEATQRTDFDGDGAADIGVYDRARSTWFIDGSTGAFSASTFGFQGVVPLPADYDGDGRADIAVYDPVQAMWYFFKTTEGFASRSFGFPGVEPVRMDFDGDGRHDVGVFYDADGHWYILTHAGQVDIQPFGYAGVEPVPADYDGDGRDDVAVYDARDGMWYVLGSERGFFSQQFGFPGTLPVQRDYDGDGTVDIAVFDPQAAVWYVWGTTAGFYSMQFGYAGVRPVPADYDGDARADMAVYDPAGGMWYVMGSEDGFYTRQFGYADAVPLN